MTNRLFAGSGILTRFIFRRDRVRLLVWIVALAGFVAAFVPVFETLLTDNGSSVPVMAMLMENPAMVAIVGPVYGIDNYTTGAMYANMMLVFSVMTAGVMNIFLVSRHTRQDEELGRLEVIRSLPVGRLSNLASTLLVAGAVNTALAVCTGLGTFALRAAGMTFWGCMLFGAALGVIGLFFAAAAAVFCQCTANNRTALGFSLMLLFVLYMLRAMGDVSVEALSLVSPLGLILRTEIFVNDYWWPVFVVLGITALLIALAFGLARMRDLGRGLVPEKPGRRHAAFLLNSPYGLALKLMRTPMIVWTITVFVLAGMYGSVFGDMESFIGSNDMLKAIFAATQDHSLLEQFIVVLMAIMSMIAAIPVLSFVGRVAAEEKQGHTEHLLGRAVSRRAQMSAYFVPSVIASVMLQVLSALGFWVVGSTVLATTPALGIFICSALSYLPAMWVLMGIVMALVAFAPSLTALGYVYLGYSFVAVYLGAVAGLPAWMKKLTPFGYVSRYPVEEMEMLPLAILTLLAAGLVLLAFWGYGRRDVKMQ